MTYSNQADLISVIVPVFNVSKYICDSISSICAQSYRNIEIILVDDGSTDNSIEKAELILKKNNMNYKIIHQENLGLPNARNTGLINSEGKYVTFIDSDDCIAPKHIEYMHRALIDTNAKIAYSDFEETDTFLRMGKKNYYQGWTIIDGIELINGFKTRKIKIHCCTLLILRSWLGDIRFNNLLRYGEDVEFMWRVFVKIDNIVHCHQNTYKYLIRKNSIMSTYAYDRDAVFVREFSKTMNDLAKKFSEKSDIIYVAYNRNIVGWLHSLAKRTNYDQFVRGCNLIDRSQICSELLKSKDLALIFIALILNISTRLFYVMARIK